jgi:GTPase SAR1 family protein
MSDSDSEGEERHQFKVILLGDGAVGKTSITRRFTNDEFKQSYLQTIGVDWSMKTVILPGT